PVWQKCLELGIAPTFHNGHRRSGLRASPSNFTYNHVGHFVAANHATCKAMLLGGVSRRFPGLNMSFLEGGVGWACMLYADLLGHWEKRNSDALQKLNPRNVDRKLLRKLAERYGSNDFVMALVERDGWPFPQDERL